MSLDGGQNFKSVSLFLRGGLEWDLEEFLRSRDCVGELGVVSGGDFLDWDVDRQYFLDGLEYLQKNRNVRRD